MDRRPPRELWPDLIYSLPEIQYGDTLNVATELLDRHVAEGRGGRAAFRFDGRTITYAALQQSVNRIGNGLRAIGVQPGDRVLLRIPNRPEFAACWLAIQKIGAVGVATMPMLRDRELAYMLDDAGAKVAIVAADLRPELDAAIAQLNRDIPVVEAKRGAVEPAALVAHGDPELEAYPTPRDALSMIAYTSGSTGPPKGACHTPADIVVSGDTYGRYILEPTPEDVFGGHPTMAFTFGLGGLLVFPMRFGSATVLLDQFTPERMLQTVSSERITVLFCAATTYRLLLQVPGLAQRFDLSSLRLCISAGEPLPLPVYEEWVDRTGIELLDCLGSTEMFHVFVCQRAGAVKPGATGLPVPGYEIRVVDERMNDVPAGTPGLLAVRGPTGCKYWGKEDRQREYVRAGWNVPNDIVVQDAEGYFWYQCRNDDLIICAGNNVSPPDVEAVLLEHPAVLEAAVVASPDPVKGFVPAAYVVLKPEQMGSEMLTVELQEHVKRHLAPYKYPRRVVFVDALPKTETGKIKRVELRNREASAVHH
jgi:2-aminobenzoate-CoA ligase